ncbi:MAG: alpha amylase N-terminal ig-like domain-containing protein [Oscillospiraceae bacterium]|nr:alpha amylase N-terminal ig-like domain-containing protein [Oscillospiraceae bacterium]
MNFAAVSHEATSRDALCLSPGRFFIRLRCAMGDLESVILHWQDKYIPTKYMDTRRATPMHISAVDGVSEYWETEIDFSVICLRYFFELRDREGRTVYLSCDRFIDYEPHDIDEMYDLPQVLREEGRFITPEWAENAVVYQVFPSRFAASKPVPERKWYKAPITAKDEIGGDLPGLSEKLGHIRELGADILYLTPVFKAHTTHKYDTVDYYQIDPSFGTEEDLINLVGKAHSLGLRVILDGVFNHTSTDFFAFEDVKRNGEKSQYLDWYYVEGFPLRSGFGVRPNFLTFGYYSGMPKLNQSNPDTAKYFIDVALYWLRRANIDGWRLDVADEIGHRFWKDLRGAVRAEFPEALLVGEVWHYAPDFLDGDEWDSVMNYPFYRAVHAATHSGKPSRIAADLNYLKGRLNPKVWPLLWNLLDSHDTPRLLHISGGDKRRARLEIAIQMLSPGCPFIYYGDEYGLEGGRDPDCRRGMLWDETRQDAETYTWYRRLIEVRKDCPGLLSRESRLIPDDGRGLLIMLCDGRAAFFNLRDERVPVPEVCGKPDMITERSFSGELEPFGVCVIAGE